jgi:hypothetical protein
MATKRARIAGSLVAAAVLAAIVGTTLYYRHGSTPSQIPGGEPSTEASRADRLPPVPSRTPNGPTPEPGDSTAARLRARATLQECLKKAESAAKVSWDGMCASLAQRQAEQRDNCRQQGRTAAECSSSYAETPVKDCLLPHQTAVSIAQAQQSGKSDCYQQFQAEFR